jgi:hypothetical protein
LFWEGPRSRCHRHTAALRLIMQSCDEDGDKVLFFLFFRVMEHQWKETDGENRSTRRKTCPSATLSTTNPTWTGPGSNPGLRGERTATNR